MHPWDLARTQPPKSINKEVRDLFTFALIWLLTCVWISAGSLFLLWERMKCTGSKLRSLLLSPSPLCLFEDDLDELFSEAAKSFRLSGILMRFVLVAGLAFKLGSLVTNVLSLALRITTFIGNFPSFP